MRGICANAYSVICHLQLESNLPNIIKLQSAWTIRAIVNEEPRSATQM